LLAFYESLFRFEALTVTVKLIKRVGLKIKILIFNVIKALPNKLEEAILLADGIED